MSFQGRCDATRSSESPTADPDDSPANLILQGTRPDTAQCRVGSRDVGVYEAFNQYQESIDADPTQVSLARARRDLFIGALEKADDVKEIVKSGSLERRTQLEPIHDVDLIMVFDSAAVPDWGTPGRRRKTR